MSTPAKDIASLKWSGFTDEHIDHAIEYVVARRLEYAQADLKLLLSVRSALAGPGCMVPMTEGGGTVTRQDRLGGDRTIAASIAACRSWIAQLEAGDHQLRDEVIADLARWWSEGDRRQVYRLTGARAAELRT